MRILLWHVHGGWTDAFVRGAHDYLLPTTPTRDSWGLGAGGRDWPNALEIAPEQVRDADVDAVLLQRPEEIAESRRLLGCRIGRDMPAVYVEHNVPRGDVPHSRHPLADRDDLIIVHVTHFNALMWDTGSTATTVIEHGIPDPGLLYTGELAHCGVVVNEPVRRGRVVGTDLLGRFAVTAPLDVFGIKTDLLTELSALDTDRIRVQGDLPTHALHAALARRRVYLHPFRWTSLGLALLEAMHLGMPIVALDVTEARRAVPPEAGALSNDLVALTAALRNLIEDPERAAAAGAIAREAALAHYNLTRFQHDWDELLADLPRRSSRCLPPSPPWKGAPDEAAPLRPTVGDRDGLRAR
ncbi:glycosyltransferase [Rathayibacter toxicus]|uniref:glycosyltransferase n=1 Tax=Rathayibacter toxicus TaxID=145458 RepID=UPI0009E5301E|nr:glycosyltransferase [Rathayibacter toxicus]PPG22480.1 glycosyl transferase [Rathayibacter toxicus]PPG47200.1 glycosyl transferase [Rathayibacter toxicus]PPH64039.1 glycosyl transferase [Rathayibacter toxicus]PPH68356.1 glycosyl transferase [Rathayibacter toxicus]PPH73188.1 glycosyl transferase [Rathayibacter toxicus]